MHELGKSEIEVRIRTRRTEKMDRCNIMHIGDKNKYYLELLKYELENRNFIELVVSGNSMMPTICSGAVVKVKKSDEYKIGDIIAYVLNSGDNNSIIVVHRVVFVRKDYVLAMGDNNNFIDRYKIKKNDIIGKVVD